jgi:hypothetical protein
MPKFAVGRDIELFKSFAREVVDDVVENIAVLFKVNLNETKVNLYGEATNKTWYPGVELNVLINKSLQSAGYEGFGSDVSQNVEFRFDRWMLEEKNTYPEIGDIIFFDQSYYEIDNTTEVQFVGGLPSNNFSVVCSTFIVRKSALNIEERIK